MASKLEIFELATGKVVRTFDVEGRGEREIEQIMRGALINMSPDFAIREAD